MKKTAVIADATSPEFFFPRWRRYYGGLFGFENLHVVTYVGMKPLFQDAGIGNLWEVNGSYNDVLRANLISDLTAALLNSYDVILRCDVDEFLVPEPVLFRDLADYVEKNKLPYITAEGVDVIELEGDPALDPNLPVLGARQYGMRSAALNKTCLTTIPLRWAPGFHAANVFPRLTGLYNFHLKFADLKSRIAWHEKMLAGLPPGTSEHKYFAVGTEHLTSLQRMFSKKLKIGVETAAEFNRRFLNTVSYNPANKIYQGDFISQEFLFSIDENFYGSF
jgi:hypothetical protein